MDCVFKKNVSQSIQNSLVLIIIPGRMFSFWCWLIRTIVLDRWDEEWPVLVLSPVSSEEKFLWIESLLLVLSYWKPFEFGLFNSKSSSSSSSPSINKWICVFQIWHRQNLKIIIKKNMRINKSYFYHLHPNQQEGWFLLFLLEENSYCHYFLPRLRTLRHSLEKLMASSSRHQIHVVVLSRKLPTSSDNGRRWY